MAQIVIVAVGGWWGRTVISDSGGGAEVVRDRGGSRGDVDF